MKSAVAATLLILVTAFTGTALAAGNHASEISSAAKPKQTHNRPIHKQIKAKPGPHPRTVRAPFGWRPADPSFDPQGRPYRPPPGLNCPIDLGYGRWASCNDEF